MKYTQKYQVGGLATTYVYFFVFVRWSDRRWSTLQVSYQVPGSRLLVAGGGSLRFGCQHHAPRRIRSRGHPFIIAAVNKKILAPYVKKNAIRSVDKKPDIGKWPGVGPTSKNLRLTPNSCFLLAGLYYKDVIRVLNINIYVAMGAGPGSTRSIPARR